MNEKLMGVFAPITTPFCEDGAVDYAGLEKNMAFQKFYIATHQAFAKNLL